MKVEDELCCRDDWMRPWELVLIYMSSEISTSKDLPIPRGAEALTFKFQSELIKLVMCKSRELFIISTYTHEN